MPDDKTILIVEDNADNRTLIKDVLDALDFGVLEATDGVEGVDLALKHKPALILMDLSLPNKDGWEATREIKANPDTSKTPIIALTAHAMVGDRERALEADCDDYISKPINLMELNEKIKKLLAEKPASEPAPEPASQPVSEETKAKDESTAAPGAQV